MQQVALVTGSSSGIGAAIAKELALGGWHVIVQFNKNQKKAEAVRDAILAQNGHVDVLGFDVSDSTAVEKSLDSFFKERTDHALGAVINNAGIHIDGMAGLMSDGDFDSVMKTNLYGSFYVTRYAIRKMIRARRGSIVNIASLAGQMGNPGQLNYAASKAGMIAMTKTLAMELGKRNIRVNAIAPGLIETEMLDGIPQIEKMLERVPLGRLGKPEEVAALAAFLCSEKAAYITGATISINGGLYPA
jgi:3-oxoacyl-[acyl-carrier protein] reductase